MVVVWADLVIRQLRRQTDWYEAYRGFDFAKSFYDNIMHTVSLVVAMPDIGRLEKQGKRKTTRSILTHPRCRIYYRYDEKTIEIIRLYFNNKLNG